MRQLTNARTVMGIGMVAALTLGSAVGSAAVITPTIVSFTNDADSGIAAANTYTHKIDLVNDGTGATINGVTFDPVGGTDGTQNQYTVPDTLTGPNFTYTKGTAGALRVINFGYDAPAAGGDTGINALFADFVFNQEPQDVDTTNTATLSGLTVGQQYEVRIYNRPFGGEAARNVNVEFTNGSSSDSLVYNSQTGPNYLSYTYTADATSLSVAFTNTGPDGFHLYGLSNQAVPEPAALSTALVAGGLLAVRRRRHA